MLDPRGPLTRARHHPPPPPPVAFCFFKFNGQARENAARFQRSADALRSLFLFRLRALKSLTRFSRENRVSLSLSLFLSPGVSSKLDRSVDGNVPLPRNLVGKNGERLNRKRGET